VSLGFRGMHHSCMELARVCGAETAQRQTAGLLGCAEDTHCTARRHGNGLSFAILREREAIETRQIRYKKIQTLCSYADRIRAGLKVTLDQAEMFSLPHPLPLLTQHSICR